MLAISKEKFVNALNSIQKGLCKREEFNNALDKTGDGFFVCTIGEDWLTTLLDLLSELVGDKNYGYGTTLEWFLFEDVKKEIIISPNSPLNNSDEKIIVDCSTPELLYDYFDKYGG